MKGKSLNDGLQCMEKCYHATILQAQYHMHGECCIGQEQCSCHVEFHVDLCAVRAMHNTGLENLQ